MRNRLHYLRRIFKVYFSKQPSYLTFWHETPAVSGGIRDKELGAYYQTFEDKVNYDGPKDAQGVILFDYFYDIGRQYNPLAVAQYGLGHHNRYLVSGVTRHLEIAKTQADWLVENLEPNAFGLFVWKHKFQWHYKKYLEAGWFSAHSQGTGISLLGRMYKEMGDKKYLETAEKAFPSLATPINKGGVQFRDDKGNVWLEEYLVEPPTHILNGFLWALWGVWDYHLLLQETQKQMTLSGVEGLHLEKEDRRAQQLFGACVKTLKENLPRYDLGFWSRYDLSKQTLPMIASPFYHKLHIVQLKVMHILTGEEIFDRYVKKFEAYQQSWLKRKLAFILKAIFKIFYF